MALVPVGNGSGFFLTVTTRDNGNNRSTLEYALRSADFATAQTDAATILGALGGVSGMAVQSTSLSLREFEDAFAFPASGVEAEIKARISFSLAGQPNTETLDIPAPVAAIFVATSGDSANTVDILDAAVASYMDLFKSTGVAFISDGEDLDQALRGRRVSVKRGLRSS